MRRLTNTLFRRKHNIYDAVKFPCGSLKRRWNSVEAASAASKTRDRNEVNVSHTTKTDDTGASSSSLNSAYDEERANATILVDNLLEYTHSLMTGAASMSEKTHGKKANDDIHQHSHSNSQPQQSIHNIIAFSGGIDSSVATALVHRVATSDSLRNHSVTAALGISPAVPSDQIALAEQVAKQIGVELHLLRTTEGSDDIYIANEGKACLVCKTHLYTCLSSIAEYYENENKMGGIDDGDLNENIDHSNNNNKSNPQQQSRFQLYNGTNADDLQDPTRLGLIAANNFEAKSPLQHTPKALVRIAGKHLGLPNWNYAASPCLRSRLALGVEAIPSHLRRIEQAEQFVRSTLNLNPTQNMRVRLLSENKAMIEVDATILERARESMDTKDAWKEIFIDTLGFSAVGVRRFKTGSVAKR